MKRLLVLSPWFPFPADNGSRIRIFHLLRELSESFQIRLVAGVQEDSPPDTPHELAALCESIVRVPWIWHDGSSGGLPAAVRALLSPVPRSIRETPNPALSAAISAELAGPIDAVLVCEMGMDAYLPPVPPGIPAILEGAEAPTFDRAGHAAVGTPARPHARLTHAKARRYWRHALPRYAAVTAVSGEEADALRRIVGPNGPKVVVIPNGVDTNAYPPRDWASVIPGRMLYNGALTYGPNRDAVTFFIADILPRIAARIPAAHLVVTGRHTPEAMAGILPNARVLFTGYLPDLRPTLATAAACVVPLQSGGGTRLKILEAWAAGIPVVATQIGAAGLGAATGEQLLLADHPTDFADAALRLLEDSTLAQQIAAKGRQFATERYDWHTIGRTLTALVEAALT